MEPVCTTRRQRLVLLIPALVAMSSPAAAAWGADQQGMNRPLLEASGDGTAAFAPLRNTCDCFPCGETEPGNWASGACSPANGACSATRRSSGCYTNCEGDCQCGPKTCVVAAPTTWIEAQGNAYMYKNEDAKHLLIVTAVSSGLLDFASNLLHSLALVYSTGPKVQFSIVGLSPNVCRSFPLSRGSLEVNCSYATDVARDLSPEVTYKSAEYLANVAKKLEAYIRAADNAADGSMILFTDVDVVFLSDPLQFQRKKNCELWFSSDRPGDECFSNKHQICSGIFVLRASPATRNLLHVALEELGKSNSYDGGDQGAIQSALQKTGMSYEVLGCDHFANGNVAFGFSEQQHRLRNLKPAAIHANFMFDSFTKRDCLRVSDLWFPNSNTEKFIFAPVQAKIRETLVAKCISSGYSSSSRHSALAASLHSFHP